MRFSIQREVPFGQQLVVVGSHEELGGWDLAQGLPMKWGEGHIWQAVLPLPPGAEVEFKVGGAVGAEWWAQLGVWAGDCRAGCRRGVKRWVELWAQSDRRGSGVQKVDVQQGV